MELKFYYCKHCGKIVAMIKNSNTPTTCCGDCMVEMRPNLTDGAFDKHVPVIELKNNVVSITVGSELHPMSYEHHIEWIALETTNGFYLKHLAPLGTPSADFILAPNEKFVAAYEYCNLHLLWKK